MTWNCSFNAKPKEFEFSCLQTLDDLKVKLLNVASRAEIFWEESDKLKFSVGTMKPLSALQMHFTDFF